MSSLSVYNTELGLFVSNSNEIDKYIAPLDSHYPGVSIDNAIYLPSHMIDYIYPDELEPFLEFGDKYFNKLRMLSRLSNKYAQMGRTIDTNLGYSVNSVNIFKGIRKQIIPDRTTYDNHKFEYDVHAFVVSILNYQYYLSDTNSVHHNDEILTNPLRDVTKVSVLSNGNSARLVPPIGINEKYLCSRPHNNNKYYKDLVTLCRNIIKDCYINYNYDISRLVYGVMLGSIYVCLSTNDYNRYINISRSLMQLSSYNEVISNKVYGSIFFDSVNFTDTSMIKHLNSKGVSLRPTDPTSLVIGKRYIRRKKTTNVDVVNSNYVQKPESFVKDITNVASGNLGWYSYSPIKMNLEKRMFHVDIHSAYPVRYHKYTGKIISKRDFGKLKCTDIVMYQKIRKEIEEYSNLILDSFEHELLYWKTDGGVVLADNDDFIDTLRINFPDVVIEEIIDTIPLRIHDSVEIPDSLKNTELYKTRVFAYKVFNPNSIHIVYANMFETYKDTVLEHNDMLGLSRYNANLLSEILINRRG